MRKKNTSEGENIPMDAILDALTISENDIHRYEEDGVVCLRSVIDEGWLERLREATEEILAGETMNLADKDDKGKYVGDLDMFRKQETFRAFAFESPSWAIAKKLMRSSRVRLFSDQLFVKEPGSQTPTPWHHDQTYWPVLGDHVCSIWVTMDPVTRESSGLEYIKGSHRWNRRFEPQNFGQNDVASRVLNDAANEKMPDIDAHRDQYEFLSWDMQPGDVLVHHSLAIHGAAGNKSNTMRRRAVSTRWFGDQAYYRPSGRLQPDTVKLKPGDPMDSDLFPIVPAN